MRNRQEVPTIEVPTIMDDGKLMRAIVGTSALVLLALVAGAQQQSNPSEVSLPPGQVIENVQCAGNPAQAYALYVPSHYTGAKSWPIIYTFDPSAHGKVPVELYRKTAEKYGYIIAASNNSRNFQTESLAKVAQALWDDTHLRLVIDARRVYMMGLSGGARVATSLALACENCAVAGVIVHGAGYPISAPPSDKDRFAYFAFIGDKDFNWPELMELRRKKEQFAAPFHLKTYAGEHQWAPADIFDEAIEWLQLKAMQSGTIPADAAFIGQLFARTQKEVEDAVPRQDTIAQYEAYRSLAFDFSGLKDVSGFQAKLKTLKDSPEMKQALKNERDAIDKQSVLTRDISSKMAQAADADLDAQQTLESSISQGMIALKREAEHVKKEDARLIYIRSFNDLWVQAMEAGQQELEINKQPGKAEFYFRLISEITPDQPWPAVLLAEAHALKGDRKRALKDLHEAVKRGMKHPESITENANLQSLRSDPEFQQMVAELKAKSGAQAR